MCGLIGMASPDFCMADFKAIETGLFLNIKRGDEGTGIGIVRLNKGSEVIKTGQDSLDFVHTKGFQSLRNVTGPTVVIGHTRKPVYGGAGKRVAHPFRVNDTILAHNGLLMNYKYLKGKYALKPQTDNDTEVLTMFLDEHGLKKMEEWSGSFALSFFYQNRLYLYRSLGSDLVLGKTKCNKFIWASEKDHLRFIFIHCGYVGEIMELPKETLWSMSLDKYPSVKKKKVETLSAYRTDWEKGRKIGREITGFQSSAGWEECESCHHWGYGRTWDSSWEMWLCPTCVIDIEKIRKEEDASVYEDKDGKKGWKRDRSVETRSALTGKLATRETLLLHGKGKHKIADALANAISEPFLPEPTVLNGIYCYPGACTLCPDWATCEKRIKYQGAVRECPRLIVERQENTSKKIKDTAKIIKASLEKKKSKKKTGKIKTHR